VQLICWDVGGADKIRKIFLHYYENTNAIIFVVDSSDKERIEEAHK
jgi:ADP-ribosylation factor 1/2